MIYLQLLGTLCGMIGAIFIMLRGKEMKWYGFWFYGVSNAALIVYFILSKQWILLGLQSFFITTSIIGGWNHRPGVPDEETIPYKEHRRQIQILRNQDYTYHQYVRRLEKQLRERS